MKKIFIIAYIATIITGCKKLTDVIDRDPPNSLVPENVATTAAGARTLLNGAYAILHDQYYYMHTEHIPGTLSGTMRRNGGTILDQQFQDNIVVSTNTTIDDYWMVFYKMINQANWVIKLVAELPESEMTQTEKNAITGQARALRAMAHFDALRYFGQFYDVSSIYGVIIRTEPADFSTRHVKRSTVGEVYNLILADLDYAIANAPDFSQPIFMSKTAAKAFKARVLLFRGDYAQAASLADEVITDNTRTLSGTFAQVFSDGFNSTEMIFMRATDAVTIVADRKKFAYGSRTALVSAWFKQKMTGDPRIAATYTTSNDAIVKVYNLTFNAPTYYMRLAEMYLIKAEGLARSGATLDEAKEPLLVIKSRAFGASQTSAATTTDELLDEIYDEIIKELSFENGSEWFAGIRFDKIMSIKPAITSVDQYILPIPDPEILSNALFGDQNPGY